MCVCVCVCGTQSWGPCCLTQNLANFKFGLLVSKRTLEVGLANRTAPQQLFVDILSIVTCGRILVLFTGILFDSTLLYCTFGLQFHKITDIMIRYHVVSATVRAKAKIGQKATKIHQIRKRSRKKNRSNCGIISAQKMSSGKRRQRKNCSPV